MGLYKRRRNFMFIWILIITLAFYIPNIFDSSREEIVTETQKAKLNVQDANNDDDKEELEETNGNNDFRTVKRGAGTGHQSDYNNNKTGTRAIDNSGQYSIRGLCNMTLVSAYLKSEDTWRPVDNEKTMYVFSAFYVKVKKCVFVIGVKPRRPVKLTCQFWNWSKKEGPVLLSETLGEVRAPTEGSGQKYTSTIFRCPLSRSEMPTHISLVTKSCENPQHLLRVHNASKTRDYRHQFTVCLSPLNFRYGRAYELVEWIELNRILGAEKFLVYNYSSAINVAEVLDYYTKRNLAEVIQWRLPMGVNTFPKTREPVEINYFGQTAALNDCLFRSKQLSPFVVNADVDEFIIPHSKNATSWQEVIKEMGQFSVYVFKNTFFRKDWAKTEMSFANRHLAEKFRLVTLQVFQHEAKVLPAGQRSKYIARTADVDLMLIHDVPAVKKVIVPVDRGLLHHYRDWENPNDKNKKVNDTTVLEKFEKSLIENVQNVWKHLGYVKVNIPII